MSKQPRTRLGAALRSARGTRTLADVAGPVGVSITHLSDVELGRRVATAGLLLRLSCVLNRPLAELQVAMLDDKVAEVEAQLARVRYERDDARLRLRLRRARLL